MPSRVDSACCEGYTCAMRSTHVIVLALLALLACKGSSSDEPAATATATTPAPPPQPDAAAQEPLPGDFPLPAGASLVRAHKRVTMLVWEYALPQLAAPDAARQLEDGLRAAAWSVATTETAGDTRKLTATHGGRLYAVAVAPAARGSTVTIHSFPEGGPTTLNAPPSYPTTFPFLAGGTASHAPDGEQLKIAYQSDPRDIELAMLLAAGAAGWTCTGTGTVTCTKDKANVTFTTERARGGSLLVVSAR